MKKTMMLKRSVIATLAAALAVTSFAGCSSSAGKGSGSSSKALDAAFSYAEDRVKDYTASQQRLSGIFSDKVYSTANAAAMMLSEKPTDEELEAIARYLYLDSITVTDETGVVTASLPKGEEGKKLKEIDDKRTFNRIVKGIVGKAMSDPVPTDEPGVYSVLAGVTRTSGSGVVVVGFKTDDYAAVTGEQLANACGVNNMVLSDGKIISTTFDGTTVGKEPEGVSAENLEKGSFDMTVGDVKYNCKSENIDDYVLITAVPAD